jgi:hypothetical protein
MSLLDFWFPLSASPGPGTADLYLAEHPGRLVIPARRKNASGPRTHGAHPRSVTARPLGRRPGDRPASRRSGRSPHGRRCDGLGERMSGVAGSPDGAEDAAVFVLGGGGGQPAGQRGRVAQAVQVVDELEPDGLGGVMGVGGLQPAGAGGRWTRPAGRTGLSARPGLPVAVRGPGHQAGYHQVIAPAAGPLGEGRGSRPWRSPDRWIRPRRGGCEAAA